MMVSIEMISILLLATVSVILLNQLGKQKRQINWLAQATVAQNEALKAMASTLYGEAMMEQYGMENKDEITH